MANIHRIGDQENNGNNGNIPQGNGPPDAIPFLMGYYEQNPKDPREENFLDFMKQSCCPQFQLKSFIVAISILEVIMFIISLSVSEVI